MKILHVSTPLAWRGGEQQLAYLIEELNKKGIEQVVLCASGSAVEEYCTEKKIPHHTFRRKYQHFILAKIVHDICKRDNISLIHTHDAHGHTAAFISALFFGNSTPLITSRRTIFPIGTNWLSKLKYNHSSVSRIVCVSEKIRELASQTIIDKSKIVTVHSGIDLSRFRNNDEGSIHLTDFGKDLSHPFIGITAAITEEKDLFTFVNTAEEYYKSRRAGTFFIIGDGPCRPRLEKYIEEKKLEDKVILTGFQKNVTGIIKQFDCFLFTSLFEGFGTSILDAMACKIPVVATRTGGIPEIIIDGYNGLLAPVKNSDALAKCVIEITTNPFFKKKLVHRSSVYVNNFTKQKMALQTLDIYRQVIFEKSSAHVPVLRPSLSA
ncbi:MAG: glycosyltransferase [Bacteroidota bacterium]|nr:glycosyltransferase [Bacteroidota bacterium]